MEMGAFVIESSLLSDLSSEGSALFLLSRLMLPLAELVIRPACLVTWGSMMVWIAGGRRK